MSGGVSNLSVEISIPVPWGHISGKLWGDQLSSSSPATVGSHHHRRILMVHGIQDNLGSFNRIIPTLKESYDSILTIDLPGHGMSSHFPTGFPLEFFNFVLSIKRVIDYVRWNRFVYIGHSFGGQIGTYFAAIFPEHVEKLIVLDTMEPRQLLPSNTLDILRKTMTNQLELEHKLETGKTPVYSYDEALQKLRRGRPSELSEEAAAVLLERSIYPVENDHGGTGYVFRFDQRLKNGARPTLTLDQQLNVIANISCPTLYILADQNMKRYDTYLKDMFVYVSQKENCRITVVQGNHDVHQNQPDAVNFLIDDFVSH